MDTKGNPEVEATVIQVAKGQSSSLCADGMANPFLQTKNGRGNSVTASIALLQGEKRGIGRQMEKSRESSMLRSLGA